MDENNSRLLTIKEVAAILRIHRVTVSNWIKSKKLLPFVYVGNRPRFRECDLFKSNK